MVKKQNIFVVAVMVLLAGFVLAACSKSAGPVDADALKVIQASVDAGLKGQTLKSPIAIVEKGQKQASGEWPFKVEYTVANPDGSEKKVTATYNLSPTTDSMGANTWSAIEAK